MRTKSFLSIVLTLAMLVGMLPGMSLTASAAGNTTEITPTNTSGTMTITLPIHAHSFTFAADGVTITAICTAEGCTVPAATASLTIEKPELTITNSGTESAEATLNHTGIDAPFLAAIGFTGTPEQLIAMLEAQIEYVGRDGTSYEKSTTAPTDAGKYTAELTLSGVKTDEGENQSVTASVDYSIAQGYPLWVDGTQVTSENLSGTGWSYDAATDTLTLDGYSYSGEGYQNTAIYGSGDLNITLAGDSTLTVGKDQSAIVAVGALSISGGKLTVQENESEYTYFLADKVITASNITITDAQITLDTPNCKNGIYALQTVTLSDSDVDVEAKNFAICGFDAVNIPSGTVRACGGKTQASSRGIVSNKLIYIGSQVESVHAEGVWGTIWLNSRGVLKLGDPEDETTLVYISIPENGRLAAKNSGWVIVDADNQVADTAEFLTCAPTDQEVTWSSDGIDVPWDDMFTIPTAAGAATYSVTNGTGEGTYDAQTGKLTVTKCGTFTVKVSTAATATYPAGTVTSATLTVNKENSVAATVTANNRTYDGTEQPLVTVDDSMQVGGAMQFALGTDAVTAPTDGWNTSIPAETNAGTYFVWYKLVGDGNHNNTDAACATVTIAPVSVTLTANSGTETYDGTEKSVSGFTSSVEGLTFEGVTASGSGTNAGTYAVTFSGVTLNETRDSTGNYLVTDTTNGTLIIGKKAAAITADDKSKTYGDDDPELTATVSGLVGEDSLNYTLSRAAGEDVGEYAITAILGENPNYDVTVVDGKLTIGKKAATVTANDNSKTYGDDDPELTATVEGAVGEDTLYYTLSRAAGEDVGEYAITVTLGENPNYEITTTPGTFTIDKRTATITADDKSKNYGDDDPALTATVEGAAGTDTLNYTLSRAAGENVGEYAITVTLGENPNYDVTVTDGKLTIRKRRATITVLNKSKTYGEHDPAMSAYVSGLVRGERLDYRLSRAAGENVGEYAITVTLGENPNYEITAVDGTLTINKADPSYTVPEGLAGMVGWTLDKVDLPAGWSWVDPTQKIEEVGEHSFKAIFTPEDTQNYNVVENIDLVVTAKSVRFVDVPEGSYFFNPVYWAVANDITGGVDETHFAPDRTVMRADAMVFFWAAKGRPGFTNTGKTFKDVKKKHWAYSAVMWAVEQGITGGTDKEGLYFGPSRTCTRSEILQFLYAAEDKPEYTIENPYSDVTDEHWYKDGAIWAYEKGLEKGENGKFKAKTPCTRGCVVTYLYRFMTGKELAE